MKDYQENIIPATNQNSKNVFMHPNPNSKLKILFVGNSITKHAPKPQVGWDRDCGMAASCLEKDYVHLLVEKAKQYDPNLSWGIAQVATFSRNFEKPEIFDIYQEAADFNADIIMMFFGANVSKEYDKMENPPYKFGDAYYKLAKFLNKDGHAKMFHSEGFYIRPVLTAEKKEAAEKLGEPFISMEDVYSLDETHGMFNHPSDFGMQMIADKFWGYMEPAIKEFLNK